MSDNSPPSDPTKRMLRPSDFEARIYILAPEEGGRRTPVFNGVRWDFTYVADDPDPDGYYMIWPRFIDASGNPVPEDVPLRGECDAEMRVVAAEMRPVHRQLIRPGVLFNCMEGWKVVARGVVTKVTGLAREA